MQDIQPRKLDKNTDARKETQMIHECMKDI